ncbi:MAG: hypothetical protein C4K48_08370 [Candidatus Thorarchaeota archaeon]|nr:MAG: hypothetical protein C4K48_08370 [Candidatus Thorarchaeota archaeon]
MSDLKKIGDLLILIGAIIGLIEGILTALRITTLAFLPYPAFGLDPLITGILGIIFALIALVNSGTIKIKILEFSNKWLIVLIMGILMYVFASGLGGILVIIGSLLLLVK